MMSNTPRVFVGTTTFLLRGMTSDACLGTVSRSITQFAGVRIVNADLIGGLVTVTADQPVDRANIVAAITLAGYAVLA